MKIREIPSSWIIEEEYRLDCGPYTSGRIEALKTLDRVSSNRLVELTKNGIAGMYHVGMDKLRWVEDPEAGVTFLRSSDILKAELGNQPLISRSQVRDNYLFTCPSGSTLITRSGSIGRMAYCRDEMARVAISQDVLKVVPDEYKVKSGYLYAFLSGSYGLPLVVAGTFGSIIVHIEAENIADLPVPRLGSRVEQKAHDLVEEAAQARTLAANLLGKAEEKVLSFLGEWKIASGEEEDEPCWTQVPAQTLSARCDAYYYSAKCLAARRAFDEARDCEVAPLGEYAEVFIPGIFKRLYSDAPEFGHPYITGADVFQIAPTSERYLLKRVAEEYRLLVKKGMILIQEAGQLGGLIGRSVLVGDYLDGFAVSNNMVRVSARDPQDTGYLYAVLSCEPGVTLIAREAAGSSIPHLEEERVRQIRIPWAKSKVRATIGQDVIQARDLRDDACVKENQARKLVEDAIERVAK